MNASDQWSASTVDLRRGMQICAWFRYAMQDIDQVGLELVVCIHPMQSAARRIPALLAWRVCVWRMSWTHDASQRSRRRVL